MATEIIPAVMAAAAGVAVVTGVAAVAEAEAEAAGLEVVVVKDAMQRKEKDPHLDNKKNCALYVAIVRLVIITTPLHVRAARASSDEASPGTLCISASTATAARSTCICAASARSAD